MTLPRIEEEHVLKGNNRMAKVTIEKELTYQMMNKLYAYMTKKKWDVNGRIRTYTPYVINIIKTQRRSL